MSRAEQRPLLVTGGAGFIGSNLADRLASAGHRVLVYDALSRPGVERNLAWLTARHGDRITPIIADIRDRAALAEAVRGAGAVFHLAAQVAVTTSLADPREDFETNVAGTFHLLEAARREPGPLPFVFASTNKVYGDLADLDFEETADGHLPRDRRLRSAGIDESRPLDFHTPYGCSKGAADQYVLDHARSYGLPATVLRMSCVYGERQMGTEDQGWVAHFLISLIEDRPITLYGDGRQVRDILYVADAVDAYLAAWERATRIAGRAFNLGGGPANAVSLLGLIDHLAALTGIEPDLRFEGMRAGDQLYFVADARRARAALGLAAPTPWTVGVERLHRWLVGERGAVAAAPAVAAAAAL